MRQVASPPESVRSRLSSHEPVLQALGVSCDGPLSANEELDVDAPAGEDCDGPPSAMAQGAPGRGAAPVGAPLFGAVEQRR